MRKQILLIAALAATGMSAEAQKGLLQTHPIMPTTPTGTDGKTTATLYRIAGIPTYRYDGAQFLPDDSIGLSYTGIRGGIIPINVNTLIFYQAPVLKPDVQTGYNYNNGTSSYDKTSQTISTYDTKHNMLTVTTQNWNSGTSSWDNSNKTTNTYDGNNNNTEAVDQSWNGASWDNTYKSVNTYNSNNQIMESTRQTWNGSAWDNNYKNIYTYNSGRVETQIQQNWSGGAWVNSNKTTYIYTGTNSNPDTKLYQVWSGGAWQDNFKNMYTFAGTSVTSVGQTWTGTWDNSDRTEYTLDANNNITTVVSQSWDGTNWKNMGKINYGFNSNALVSSYDGQTWNTGGFWEYAVGAVKQLVYYESYTNSVAGVAKAQGNLEVYPNPAVAELNINMVWDNAQPFTVAIYDMQGRIVKQLTVPAMKNYTTSIDIADMVAGNYMLVVKGTSGQTSSMFAVGK